MIKRPETGKTALVTGGTRRIGKAICLALSALGYNIALHYHRSARDAKLLAAQINEQHGGRCRIFQADLSRERDAQKLISQVLKSFKRAHVLINNASEFKPSSIKNTDDKTLRQSMMLHVHTPHHLMRQFALKCKEGQIINMLDTNITRNATKHTAYLLSKKTLAELTQMAAVELAPHIRVNAIAPGLILPPDNAPSGHLKRLAKSIPLKKKGDVSHITKTVAFLLSNDYITGQIIYVDGGEHLL